MNNARSDTAHAERRVPTDEALPFLRPVPEVDDLDGDIDDTRLQYSTNSPSPAASIPEKNWPVLGIESMVLSAPLIRKIEQELRKDE